MDNADAQVKDLVEDTSIVIQYYRQISRAATCNLTIDQASVPYVKGLTIVNEIVTMVTPLSLSVDVLKLTQGSKFANKVDASQVGKLIIYDHDNLENLVIPEYSKLQFEGKVSSSYNISLGDEFFTLGDAITYYSSSYDESFKFDGDTIYLSIHKDALDFKKLPKIEITYVSTINTYGYSLSDPNNEYYVTISSVISCSLVSNNGYFPLKFTSISFDDLSLSNDAYIHSIYFTKDIVYDTKGENPCGFRANYINDVSFNFDNYLYQFTYTYSTNKFTDIGYIPTYYYAVDSKTYTINLKGKTFKENSNLIIEKNTTSTYNVNLQCDGSSLSKLYNFSLINTNIRLYIDSALMVQNLYLYNNKFSVAVNATLCGTLTAKTITDLNNVYTPDWKKVTIIDGFEADKIQLSSFKLVIRRSSSYSLTTIFYDKSFSPINITLSNVSLSIDNAADIPHIILWNPSYIKLETKVYKSQEISINVYTKDHVKYESSYEYAPFNFVNLDFNDFEFNRNIEIIGINFKTDIAYELSYTFNTKYVNGQENFFYLSNVITFYYSAAQRTLMLHANKTGFAFNESLLANRSSFSFERSDTFVSSSSCNTSRKKQNIQNGGGHRAQARCGRGQRRRCSGRAVGRRDAARFCAAGGAAVVHNVQENNCRERVVG
ncbi:hypothetical protein GPJ56_001995 [Histomonas meleagridis]|uniref:uncharacterized protein n=1 Tax=Histomonas meleagridis TaxID=135588 RepID=UPI0035594D16|nr:hypothetical protein GPJ56_001995 [Histomonas meleagridis]KAH0800928.1 hypothetical protein GO595_006244 [Histomonas meleagridis]